MLQSDDEESKIELDPTDSKRASGRQAEPACVVPTLGPIFSQRDDVMNISWIKLFRKFKEWGWYKDSHMVHLFIHFLLSANYRDNEWMGISIRRGQVATGLRTLSEDTGISIQTIRTCINRLKSTREITIKSTNRFSVITIENYEEYQNKEVESTRKSTGKLTNDQQTTNKQLTTTKERKERKEKKTASDDFFWEEIRKLYTWVNIDAEIVKMKAYMLTPRGRTWRMTRRSVVNWLNKIDKPITQQPVKRFDNI